MFRSCSARPNCVILSPRGLEAGPENWVLVAIEAGGFAVLLDVAAGGEKISAAVCFLLTVLDMARGDVGYAMIGFGLFAGFLQWWHLRERIAKRAAVGRNSILVQLYGMVILTGVCSAPAIILGRVITGQTIF